MAKQPMIPEGAVIYQQIWDGKDWVEGKILKILSADPKIKINDEMINQIVRGTPWSEFNAAGFGKGRHTVSRASVDDLVTFKDDFGQSYVYRLIEYDPLTNVWTAQWPD